MAVVALAVRLSASEKLYGIECLLAHVDSPQGVAQVSPSQ